MNKDIKLIDNEHEDNILMGSLRVAPYGLLKIIDVRIENRINEHGTLYFKGLLPQRAFDSYSEIPAEGTNVSLSTLTANEELLTIFQGVVTKLIIMAGPTMHIEVYASSYSMLLDVSMKSRSFQHKSAMYRDVVNQVVEAYDGGSAMDKVTDGVPTNRLIMQHAETDWAFLKRLASHFNAGIVCDSRLENPKIYFGIPTAQEFELDHHEFVIKQDMQRFRRLQNDGISEIVESDFARYELSTDQIMFVGDAVLLHGRQLYVSEILSIATQGVLISHVILVPKRGLCQPYIFHEDIVGASFRGQVVERRNDRVRVHLDVDEWYDPIDSYWFPYSTVYSSKNGSGWYCMPEIGDVVRIYFPDGDDDHAYAISSVHEPVNTASQQSSSQQQGSKVIIVQNNVREDPDIKEWTYGSKLIRLCDDGLYIVSGDTKIEMNDEGIQIVSENDIEFKSDKNIVMHAKNDIQVVGTERVGMSGGTPASINIDSNVEISGNQVRVN